LKLQRAGNYTPLNGSCSGTVEAPNEAEACKQAIEFYDVPANQQFRVVATQVVEKARRAKS